MWPQSVAPPTYPLAILAQGVYALTMALTRSEQSPQRLLFLLETGPEKRQLTAEQRRQEKWGRSPQWWAGNKLQFLQKTICLRRGGVWGFVLTRGIEGRWADLWAERRHVLSARASSPLVSPQNYPEHWNREGDNATEGRREGDGEKILCSTN